MDIRCVDSNTIILNTLHTAYIEQRNPSVDEMLKKIAKHLFEEFRDLKMGGSSISLQDLWNLSIDLHQALPHLPQVRELEIVRINPRLGTKYDKQFVDIFVESQRYLRFFFIGWNSHQKTFYFHARNLSSAERSKKFFKSVKLSFEPFGITTCIAVKQSFEFSPLVGALYTDWKSLASFRDEVFQGFTNRGGIHPYKFFGYSVEIDLRKRKQIMQIFAENFMKECLLNNYLLNNNRNLLRDQELNKVIDAVLNHVPYQNCHMDITKLSVILNTTNSIYSARLPKCDVNVSESGQSGEESIHKKSPEEMDNLFSNQIDAKSDPLVRSWTLGILLYELYMGKELPWMEDLKKVQSLYQAKESQVIFINSVKQKMEAFFAFPMPEASHPVSHLIRHLLVFREKRWSISQAKEFWDKSKGIFL